MRHPAPTLQNTLLIITFIILLAMMIVTIGLFLEEAREDDREQAKLNAGCHATNARFQAISNRFNDLYETELHNTVSSREVKEGRVKAFGGLVTDLAPMIRDCDKIYPLPGSR